MDDIKTRWKDILDSVSKGQMQKRNKKLAQISQQSVERVYGNKKFQSSFRHVLDPKYPKLYITPRQKTVLLHLSEGKTFRATAKEMSIASRTVEYFVVCMRKRFTCKKAKELLLHPLIAEYLKKEKQKK